MMTVILLIGNVIVATVEEFPVGKIR
jgi:hypothetical protein